MNAPPTEQDAQTAVHDVLSSAYRRQVLRSLVAGADDGASLGELTEALVDHDETADDRDRLAIRLHHVTLPKLAAAGFIEYDAETGTVRVRKDPPMEWRPLSSMEGV